MKKEQRKAYPQIGTYMKSYLTYSQIFGTKPTVKEIIEDIKVIDLNTALIILSQFSVLSDEGKSELYNKLKPFIRDRDMIEDTEVYDLSNLMYAIKWFLAYGEPNPIIAYNKQYAPFFHVFLTMLKITDYMVNNIDNMDQVEDLILKSSLFNRSKEIDKALIRQEVMFNELATNANLYPPKEYIDINNIFQNQYGYMIEEYVSILFSLNYPCIKELKLEHIVNSVDWGIDLSKYLNNMEIEEAGLKIIDEISIDAQSLKKWAADTIENPFDYENILSTPMFRVVNKIYPFSPGYMSTIIFDGLCFKLNQCCSAQKKSFFNFFGRLFEAYVSKSLECAVHSSKISAYKFIEEFKFGKQNKDSSDAYILMGKTLLIIECKGGRIRKETKVTADPNISTKDFEKYVMRPIKQANDAYEEILKDSEIFKDVNKVYILSVSLQSFPRIPKYHELLSREEFINSLHPTVKFFDYIGLSELELIAYIIETRKKSIFKILNTKKDSFDYVPYPNFINKKYGVIKRTDFHNKELTKAFKRIQGAVKFK
ncbi:hypothetical protein [Bacillus cereus]|uniref:hypothetical protein n=1 Tax=Bacillus cereus TaxID=1396 RepID=UPI00397FE0F8